MNRLTYGNVKDTLARTLNMCSTDSRLLDIVNQAVERLLYKGKYVGTYGRYWVCLKESCLTLPRQLETVESIAVCDRPGTVRSEWFEFLGSGPGILDEDDDIGDQIIDRGEACAFDDVRGDDKKLAVYAGTPEADGATINVQYYNSGGRWKRTSVDSVWTDGEEIPMVVGEYNYSSDYVAPLGLIRVVKPRTNGTIRLYEYDTVNGTYKPLAYYEPDETIPVYRRYLVPNLVNQSGSSSSCDYVSVIIMGKMRFMPVYRDADFLLINHIGALKLMCQAVFKEENNIGADADAYEAKALRLLEEQLGHYKGDGEIQPVTWQDTNLLNPAVENLI